MFENHRTGYLHFWSVVPPMLCSQQPSWTSKNQVSLRLQSYSHLVSWCLMAQVGVVGNKQVGSTVAVEMVLQTDPT